jgi:putative toxin-antitoxin system antitoxin component (TIGR02293 family)
MSNKNMERLIGKYGKSFENPVAVLVSSKKGLKAQAVFDFMSISSFTNQFIEQILNRSIKTFLNYKEQNTLLDAAISEKLLKLFSLYDKGLSVFSSIDEFNKWMNEPAFGLGKKVPADLLDTITGIDLIGDELLRIEHGVLA